MLADDPRAHAEESARSVSALPTPRCDDYAQEGQIGTWRLVCRRLAGKRTGLIAVGIKENVGLEVLLGVLDQEVAFVNDFTLHDRVEIITLGRRADGKTVLSYFWWQPAATGKYLREFRRRNI
jgi:hypothetical protein